MQGVGPGSVFGGRYTTTRRVTEHARFERWLATDNILDREVVLLCFDSEGPEASAALDAARRAAGIEDPRLVRVLDVGAQDAVSFVVEEPLKGAEPLVALLGNGVLPAEEARRIAGEAASGLEAARVRGLHHQVLTPHSVLRTEDGSIKVRGLAIEAALLEAEEPNPDAASRADTVALVAIAYAALTTRWPLPGQSPAPDSGLEPAPAIVGGVAAPSEIAVGVPADLDLIARLTLNDEKGPLSPGDFAAQIAPWSPVALPSGVAIEDDGRRSTRLGSAARGAMGAIARAAATAPAATVVESVGTAQDTAELAASGVGRKVGSFARAAADKATEMAAMRAERRRLVSDDESSDGEAIRLSEALDESDEGIDPPLPLLPVSTAGAPTPDQSKLAIAIVAALVVVAAVLGFWGLPKVNTSSVGLTDPSAPVVTRTVTGSPSASDAPPAPPPTSSAPPTLAPLPIAGSSEFDPSGDGVRPSRTGPQAFDGNPDTIWRTPKWYATPELGGLGKPGIGLLLDLGRPSDIHQVTVLLRGAPDLTVYVARQPRLDGAQVLGKVAGKDGAVTVGAPSGQALTGRLVILWFTRLAPDGEGRFRAQVAEVRVS